MHAIFALALAGFALLVKADTTVPLTPNLVQNGDFTLYELDTHEPVGWAVTGGEWIVEQGAGPTGNNAAESQSTDSTAPDVMQQTIPTIAGQCYEVRYQASLEGGPHDGASLTVSFAEHTQICQIAIPCEPRARERSDDDQTIRRSSWSKCALD